MGKLVKKIKELWKKLKEKISNLRKRIVVKVCDFVVDHPYIAIGAAGAAVTAAAAVAGTKVINGICNRTKYAIDYDTSPEGQAILMHEWTELGYEESFRNVQKCVEKLPMGDDEVFLFAQYVDESDNERKRYLVQSYPTNHGSCTYKETMTSDHWDEIPAVY